MARVKNPDPRYSRVSLAECEAETLHGCSVVAWVNFPIKLTTTLNMESTVSILNFLTKVIKAWDGFDMPLSKESLGELEFLEIRELVREVMAHVVNPQKRNSVSL